MQYRDRKTGAILNGKQARNKRPSALMPPEKDWSDNAYDFLNIDPVYSSPKPEHDLFFDRAEQRGAKQGEDGKWYQRWEVVSKWSTDAELRQAMINQVRQKASRYRESGITVDGVFVKTNAEGRANIAVAVQSDKDPRTFVAGDEVHSLSKTEINNIFQAMDDYVQKCWDNEATLIQQIRDSSDPRNEVDMEAGWPE